MAVQPENMPKSEDGQFADHISQLEQENERLRGELKSVRIQKVVVEKTVKPPDYDRLQMTVAQQAREIDRLRDFISFGNISTLENLIRDFKESSRIHLGKIAKEIQLMSFSHEEVSLAFELIDYLDGIRREIYALVSMCDGEIAGNPRVRLCISDMRILSDKLRSTHFLLSCSDAELEELHNICLSFMRQFDRYAEQDRRALRESLP